MTLLDAPVLKDPAINQPKLTTLQEQLTSYHYCLPTTLSLTTSSGHKPTYRWVQEAWGSGVQLRLLLRLFSFCCINTVTPELIPSINILQHSWWWYKPCYDLLDHPRVPRYRYPNCNIHRRCVWSPSCGSPAHRYMHRLTTDLDRARILAVSSLHAGDFLRASSIISLGLRAMRWSALL